MLNYVFKFSAVELDPKTLKNHITFKTWKRADANIPNCPYQSKFHTPKVKKPGFTIFYQITV